MIRHLFDRATECDRLMNLASDPSKKEALKKLRDMWMALANNESMSMSLPQLAQAIEELNKKQSGLSAL
jgi:hypothetical protein